MTEKIKSNMNLVEVLMVMSDGNPNAMDVLSSIRTLTPLVDPDGMQGYAKILLLDTLGIRGKDLNIFWSEVCGNRTVALMAVLRAYQLGGLAGVTKDVIHQAISDRTLLNIEEITAAVKERLPEFNKTNL